MQNNIIIGEYAEVKTANKTLKYGIKPNPEIKGIPTIQYIKPLTKPQTDQITYNLYVEIMEIISNATEDPEILNDVSEELEELIYKPSIETGIIKLETLDNRQYIDNLFTDLYVEEELKGLIETTITPEQYNYKILELIKGSIIEELGTAPEDIKILNSESMEIKNPELIKNQLGYYMENDIFTTIKEAVNKVLYYLDENPDIREELRNFIYINSYYKEE